MSSFQIAPDPLFIDCSTAITGNHAVLGPPIAVARELAFSGQPLTTELQTIVIERPGGGELTWAPDGMGGADLYGVTLFEVGVDGSKDRKSVV